MVFTHIRSVVLYVCIYSLLSVMVRAWLDACCVLLMLLNTQPVCYTAKVLFTFMVDYIQCFKFCSKVMNKSLFKIKYP